MNVQVILSEDVPSLGRPGDVVKVRAGYARNYLLPRGLAVEANSKNLRAFEHQKGLAMLRREANKGQALKLKQQLEALALTISANAGEEGKLFGSISSGER
jgi:large subunit ribosomal protein L9